MALENNIELSIIATTFNDGEILPILVDEIFQAINPLNVSFEIILINDYSPDNTDEIIETLCKKFPYVKAIKLARNFGQQIAMSAGIRYAGGNYIVIMDGDLQNPPTAIPILYKKIKTGYDIVYTISIDRNNKIDEFTSKLFWTLLTKFFKVRIVKNQLMLKIMTKEFIERFDLYTETIRTIGGIVLDISSNYTTINVENRKRKLGDSNYNLLKRLNLMLEMVISLSNAPLNMMIYLGFIIFIVSIIVIIITAIRYFIFSVPTGYTSIFSLLLLFGGITIFLLGFIGKYLANIYQEVRNRPLFHIQKKYNL